MGFFSGLSEVPTWFTNTGQIERDKENLAALEEFRTRALAARAAENRSADDSSSSSSECWQIKEGYVMNAEKTYWTHKSCLPSLNTNLGASTAPDTNTAPSQNTPPATRLSSISDNTGDAYVTTVGQSTPPATPFTPDNNSFAGSSEASTGRSYVSGTATPVTTSFAETISSVAASTRGSTAIVVTKFAGTVSKAVRSRFYSSYSSDEYVQ